MDCPEIYCVVSENVFRALKSEITKQMINTPIKVTG